jgi:flagellar hook-length control protein FliK
MQIVTESHQVAVRIVAEIPFVKDMLENNLHQLKAELQAQGLEVDELEVSVAHDSRADDDLYQKTSEGRRSRSSKNKDVDADGVKEDQNHSQTIHSDETADSAIDFFA